MTHLMALSISTGILCGIWTQFGDVIGLIAWAGFAGTTTYFAVGKYGLEGFFTAIRQNLFGVACGMTIIVLCDIFPFSASLFVFGGLISFVLCIAGKFKYLSYVPGSFVGCFSTFAAGGNWKVLIPSLIVGALLGLSCDVGGKLLHSMFGKSEAEVEPQQ